MQGSFLKKYDPTIEESYRKPYDVGGKNYMLGMFWRFGKVFANGPLEILDTAGTEQFVRIHLLTELLLMLVFRRR